MAREIILSYKIGESPDNGGPHRLQAWVSSYTDMDPAVFVYQRSPRLPEETLPANQAYDDMYSNIASVSDMADYPVDAPAPGLPPFFRKTSIDMYFRSVDLMKRAWTTMQEDVRSLIFNLNYLDSQGSTGTVTLP